MARKHRRIVLVGVKHAGKSSVGRALARCMNVPFIDGDERIVEYARSCNGDTVSSARELYRAVGAEAFHRLEEESLQNLPGAYVYAAGGGLAECPHAWDALKDARIVLLDVSLETAWARIREAAKEEGSMPAFLQNADDPFARFSNLYKRRRAIYRAAAHLVYDGGEDSPCDIAQRIADTIDL